MCIERFYLFFIKELLNSGTCHVLGLEAVQCFFFCVYANLRWYLSRFDWRISTTLRRENTRKCTVRPALLWQAFTKMDSSDLSLDVWFNHRSSLAGGVQYRHDEDINVCRLLAAGCLDESHQGLTAASLRACWSPLWSRSSEGLCHWLTGEVGVEGCFLSILTVPDCTYGSHQLHQASGELNHLHRLNWSALLLVPF